MNKGGNWQCILYAANEIAVAAFLKEKISFTQMSSLIEACMTKVAIIEHPSYDDFVASDEEARRLALQHCSAFTS
jgi:1-deoxy-D-xylulose-5-phosphate reductoisomerase